MVEPESNEVLATNSFVLAWYNGYKVSKNIILFSQFGIPLGVAIIVITVVYRGITIMGIG